MQKFKYNILTASLVSGTMSKNKTNKQERKKERKKKDEKKENSKRQKLILKFAGIISPRTERHLKSQSHLTHVCVVQRPGGDGWHE